MKHIRLLIVMAMLFALVFGGISHAQDAMACDDSDPVLFGFVVDNSGVGVLFAESQFKGIDMAMEDINAMGGILGRCAEYIWQDSALNASQGATIAEQFVLEDEVDFLVGPTSSGVALAVTEIAREHGVPIVFHTSNSIQLSTTRFHPYIVQVAPHTTIETRAVAQYAANLDLDLMTWASIGPDYAFGRDGFNEFQPRLLELIEGSEIVTEQWPPLGESDLDPYLSAIEAFEPDAVFSNLWGDQLVNFVSTADEFGLFEEMTLFGLFDADFMTAMGADLPEGLYGYSRAPFYAIDTDQMRDFNERYFERYEIYPADWAILIYDGVHALAAAAEVAGSTEGDAVAEAFNDLSFTALRGDLTVRACDHMTTAGEYIGITTQDSDYGVPIMTDVIYVPAEDVWDSCEDIEAIRAESE